MPQAPLNPFVFNLLEALDKDLEDNTGVSRLSQGLNKDAISKQNSAAMVEQLATMSQQRQKIIARHFASFLKHLYSEVYALVVENEQTGKVIEVAGSFVPIDPRSWKEKRDVIVELTLGYGEADREAQKMLSLHQLFSQDPSIAADVLAGEPPRPLEEGAGAAGHPERGRVPHTATDDPAAAA